MDDDDAVGPVASISAHHPSPQSPSSVGDVPIAASDAINTGHERRKSASSEQAIDDLSSPSQTIDDETIRYMRLL